MLKLISSELDQSDQVHTPSCPDRGQSLNQRGSGPHRQRLYTRHVNQNLPRSEIEHIHRGLITQECCSGGIHHCRPHPPSSSLLVPPPVHVQALLYGLMFPL
jgi:hypothetical protein